MLRTSKGFLIFSGLILLFILVIENVNQRFWLSDFKVYYMAADAFMSNQPVYGQVFGENTGLYKYSPVLLYVFAPATKLGFFNASVLHYLLSCLAILGGLLLAYRLIIESTGWDIKKVSLILVLTFVAALNHFFRELHLGNVNALLVLILLGGFTAYRRQQLSLGAFLFAIALLFKPYFILLLVPFVLYRQWRLIVYGMTWLVVLLGTFFLLQGPEEAYFLHQAWFSSMREHNVLLQSWNTIPAILSMLSGRALNAFVISGLLLMLFLLVFFGITRNKRSLPSELALFLSLLALIPNLVITDTEHFLFSYPLILLLIAYAPKASKFLLVALVIGLFMYGSNSPEIFGSELSDALEHHGMLGIGNSILLVLVCRVLYEERKKEVVAI